LISTQASAISSALRCAPVRETAYMPGLCSLRLDWRLGVALGLGVVTLGFFGLLAESAPPDPPPRPSDLRNSAFRAMRASRSFS